MSGNEEKAFCLIPAAEFAKNQSKVIEGREDFSRGSPMLKVTDQPIAYLDKEAQTIHEVFLRGLKLSEGRQCLGWRPGPTQPYQWLTYQRVLERFQHFGSGLIAEGAKTEPTQFIGVFSQNRVEWALVDHACSAYSMVSVPLYDTLGPEAIKHIITQCELKLIVADVNSKVEKLLTGCKDEEYALSHIITMETPSDEVVKLAEVTGVKVMTFEQVENLGKENLKEFVPPKPGDLYTICYTSGTTGLPKGVMLTHGNIVADHAGVQGCGTEFIDIVKEDVYISFLPLAHIFERLLAVAMYFAGGSIGFFQGDVKLLTNDFAALKPTVAAMVPRLINRIYDKIHAGVASSAVKRFLLNQAVKSKTARLMKGEVTQNTIWDTLVFKKIRNLLGGRLRLCVTGAAPVSLDVINFMRCALGIVFTEGYGQTECSAGLTITVPGDFASSSVGTPALSNLVKLVDVPEKNYFAKDGKGEVCAKGHNVFIGYYKNEEKTKEALDEDGWLHTGDVGMWLPNGALKIIDRKKHIFKLAQGEYIAPEKIEGVLVQSLPVAQVFLYGESLKATLVAIAIVDPETVEAWFREKGEDGKIEDICKSEKANKLILENMIEVGKKGGLKSFELPKKIHLSSELFSIENEMLTPTFKTRRPQIEKKYKEIIDKMYEGLD